MKHLMTGLFAVVFQCYGSLGELVAFADTLHGWQQNTMNVATDPSTGKICVVYMKNKFRYLDEANPDKPDQSPK